MTDTMQQLVVDGVTAFGDVEKKCRDLHSSINDLQAILARGQALGMAGSLPAEAVRAGLWSASGHVGQALGAIVSVHRECTRIAQKHGVDVVEPNSGGVRES